MCVCNVRGCNAGIRVRVGSAREEEEEGEWRGGEGGGGRLSVNMRRDAEDDGR